MAKIYDVIAKRGEKCSRPDVCLFYDDDRENSIDYMANYRKKYGFSIDDKDGIFTIADLILRERQSTGGVTSEVSYRELFDVFGERLKS